MEEKQDSRSPSDSGRKEPHESLLARWTREDNEAKAQIRKALDRLDQTILEYKEQLKSIEDTPTSFASPEVRKRSGCWLARCLRI